MFDTVLVANRGEIALRVVRACRELGIRSVAVYSTPDRDSAAVRAADRAVHIGPAPARRSYLNVPAIIEAARNTGAQAIHPGYGFLSEDPDFAEICAANDLVFVGPSPSLMTELGDKARARALMARHGLPVLAGGGDSADDLDTARSRAEETGYPLILKASAGGGGRGMTIVRRPEDLAPAYAATRAQARAVFGDDRVYLERYLEQVRHVEVQILCDGHGHGIALGERDCSVQRRHQKLIEESPAPGLPRAVVAEMERAAVGAAVAVGYEGAGTIEFLVDSRDDSFYFMEMNCRIQVEHPVTEMVTGVDLVRQQLTIAAGEPLKIAQSDVRRDGCAIECRVNAEDPDRGFAPAAGPLDRFTPPGGPFVRVDTHGRAGWTISPDYDSLLAKVVVWAPDREQARTRARRALGEFDIAGPGVRTTIPFLARVLDDATFAAGAHCTSLVGDMLGEGR